MLGMNKESLEALQKGLQENETTLHRLREVLQKLAKAEQSASEVLGARANTSSSGSFSSQAALLSQQGER
jgi:hypothetical protein